MDDTQLVAFKALQHFYRKEYQKSSELYRDLKNKRNSNTNNNISHNNNNNNNVHSPHTPHTPTSPSTPSTPSSSTTLSNLEISVNILISDFYNNKCDNLSKLLDELNLLYRSIIESSSGNIQKDQTLTSPTLTSSPVTSPQQPLPPPTIALNNTNESTTSSNGSNQQQSPQPPQPPQQHNHSLDVDNEKSIILYNLSVILYHFKQYTDAINHLDIIYQNILSLDEYIALRTCFLLISVYISVHNYDKAFSTIVFLEDHFDHFFYLPSNNEATNKKYDHTQMTPEEFNFMIHFYKAKLYLSTNSHYLLSKTEITNSIQSSLNINYSPLISSCYLLKSNYYLKDKNSKKSIEYLEKCKNSSSNNKTTSSSSSSNNSNENSNNNIIEPMSFGYDLHMEEITPRIFYNNLGTLNFKFDKYISSVFYYTKSLKGVEDKEIENLLTKCQKTATDKRSIVFYNTGILLMVMGGKYELAFSCLQESCLLFYSNPLVWLRLAECCILAHTNKLSIDQQQPSSTTSTTPSNKTFITLPTANGLHQGLQIEDNEVQSSITSGEDPSESSRLGTLSLDFAAKCLRNANYLQSKYINSINNNNNNSNNNNLDDNQSKDNNNHLDDNQQTQQLMLSILCSQAYVALCISNPIVTLTVCKEIIKMCLKKKENHYDKYRYYAHLYSSEACIKLNIPDKAIEFLSLDFIESINNNSNQHIENDQQETVNDNDKNEFSNNLYMNLIVAYILKNDLSNAEKTIKFIEKNNSNNSKLNLLKVYIELRVGNYDKAYEILKTNLRPIPIKA
ncbi:hypothetical protein CYY_002634 [Polysphondylium violaceum]|uniref:CCR4-NOT transcription complex subunit 10 n=1 Tax=Polysphondylium violaceum TaxID=133409 RepID=A0A8J4PZ15_9MYCE|nr:hypothetical protein CYY_002634 [Polysphondylium violaceum]